MEYTHLGRTGLKVSRLCLGTMNFGSLTSEDESRAIMNQSLELGINFVDTADAPSIIQSPPRPAWLSLSGGPRHAGWKMPEGGRDGGDAEVAVGDGEAHLRHVPAAI